MTFRLHAPAARFVQVVGSWGESHWGGLAEERSRLETWRGAMHDRDGDGVWELSLSLPPGRHLYQFVLDGTAWILDPLNYETEPWAGGEASLLRLAPDD